MALLPPMYTTNATRRRKGAVKAGPKSKSLLEAEARHAKFLKRMGVGDLSRKIAVPAPEPAYARPSPEIPSMDTQSGTTAPRTRTIQKIASNAATSIDGKGNHPAGSLPG